MNPEGECGIQWTYSRISYICAIARGHVRFDDGSMLDATSLAAACKRNGTLLVLDVSQSCGAIPMDVRSLGADFIVCAGYKYLLSPWGTGFLWVKPENAVLLRPGPYNWLSRDVESFARLNYVDPRPDLDNVRRIVKLFVMVMARRISQNLTALRMRHLSYLSKCSASGASTRAVPSVWRRCHSAPASKLR
jgi:kynureninase